MQNYTEGNKENEEPGRKMVVSDPPVGTHH
jgi:hypothetical protein